MFLLFLTTISLVVLCNNKNLCVRELRMKVKRTRLNLQYQLTRVFFHTSSERKEFFWFAICAKLFYSIYPGGKVIILQPVTIMSILELDWRMDQISADTKMQKIRKFCFSISLQLRKFLISSRNKPKSTKTTTTKFNNNVATKQLHSLFLLYFWVRI